MITATSPVAPCPRRYGERGGGLLRCSQHAGVEPRFSTRGAAHDGYGVADGARRDGDAPVGVSRARVPGVAIEAGGLDPWRPGPASRCVDTFAKTVISAAARPGARSHRPRLRSGRVELVPRSAAATRVAAGAGSRRRRWVSARTRAASAATLCRRRRRVARRDHCLELVCRRARRIPASSSSIIPTRAASSESRDDEQQARA